MNIILLSGGSGKRLWPLSNDIRSKQFIKIFKTADGYESMVQRVYRQIKEVDTDASVTIATSKTQVSSIHNQLGNSVGVCVEPCRRDTFPAIALATAFLHDVKGVGLDEAVVVCPVDPYVNNDYFAALKDLSDLAEKGSANLSLMGIEPTYPSEKYGYIIPESADAVSPVKTFKEKPNAATAEKYIAQGALWNGGVFAYKLRYVLDKAHELIDFTDYQDLFRKYETLKKISFDYAVVENESKIQVMRFAGQWKDMGTWNTLTEAMQEPSIGKAMLNETCENVHVLNELDVPVLCMGLKDVVVSASPEGILVSDKEQSSYIKPYVDSIHQQIMFAEKSWGSFRVLDVEDESLTIKITLNAGHGMNYHSHENRDEVWTVISGTGRAILDGKDARVILLTGKGEETTMKRGSVFVPYPSDVELTLKYLAEYDKVHPAAPASSAKKAKKDFLPIILGSDENAYGTARLFQEAYHVTPLLLCTQQLVPTRSSHLFLCRIIPDFEREEVFPGALLGVLKQCAQDYEKLLVIPCSDYYTGLLCRHYDHFEGLIANRFISDELLETFDTKDKFYALCKQYGMDYPKTVVASPEERESVVDRLPFDFPIVVKPENSNALDYLRCHFEGQKKVFFFDTREQYLTMVHSMNQSDYRGKLILQEFIPGGDDAMRVLNSYSDLDGHVRAMCLGQPVLEYYDPKSVGNYAAIISRGDQALYDKMQEFLEKLGYVGFSNIDMKYDSRTGRYVLFEINPRLGRSSYFCRAAGLNMMKLLTNDVVYGKREDCVYNHTVALWQNVPTGILRRYVKDQELSDELKQFKGTHTLFCKGDLPLSRLYRLLRYYAAQYHNFRDYYFDKK